MSERWGPSDGLRLFYRAQGLTTVYPSASGEVRALNGVDLDLCAEERVVLPGAFSAPRDDTARARVAETGLTADGDHGVRVSNSSCFLQAKPVLVPEALLAADRGRSFREADVRPVRVSLWGARNLASDPVRFRAVGWSPQSSQG